MNDPHSMIGPYVTDALDDDERVSFERHLEECSDCRAEARELRETMAQMPALQHAAPPPELRSSILSAISSTPMLPAEVSSEAPTNVVAPDFRRSRRPVATWLAAAAAVLAVALGGVTVWQQSELREVQAAEAERIALLAAADLQVSRTTLAGADLTYLASPSRGEALITTTGFPAPENDRSWQVWVVTGDEARSAAIINEGGALHISVDGIAGGDVMAITEEPRGGSPQPTGQTQAVVELRTA